MDSFNFFSSFCLAIGLSAACGFRVFVPPLIYGIFYKANFVELGNSWSWIGNDWIIILLTVASIIELLATFVPLIDNLLDIIATPASIIAGTILSFSSLNNLDPGLQWLLSIICGLGVTSFFQVSTVSLRVFFTTFSGGIFNPFFSFMEDVLTVFISISSILIPIIGLIIVIIMSLLIYFLIKKIKSKNKLKGNKYFRQTKVNF